MPHFEQLLHEALRNISPYAIFPCPWTWDFDLYGATITLYTCSAIKECLRYWRLFVWMFSDIHIVKHCRRNEPLCGGCGRPQDTCTAPRKRTSTSRHGSTAELKANFKRGYCRSKIVSVWFINKECVCLSVQKRRASQCHFVHFTLDFSPGPSQKYVPRLQMHVSGRICPNVFIQLQMFIVICLRVWVFRMCCNGACRFRYTQPTILYYTCASYLVML